MSVEVIDPTSAAGIASSSLSQALAALKRALQAAGDAATSAQSAAAAQAAIAVLLQSVGVAHRWTGTVLQIQLPDGSYGMQVDLKGGKGDNGESPTLHPGSITSGSPASFDINNSDPLNPILDLVLPPGASGLNGWTPVMANVTDGARVVQKVVDWTGGTGTKPQTGLYVGANGFVPAIADGVDQRGAPGSITHTGSVADGDLTIFSGVTGNLIESGGATTAFGRSLLASISAVALKTLLAISVADVSGAQAALGYTAENVATKGQASGYAALDPGGKVPLAQLPASVTGALNYVSVWDASTNSPALSSGVGVKGQFYKVGTAGATLLDGKTQWNVGDLVIFDGITWDKVDGIANEVVAVAGLVGSITAAALKVALAISVADISGLGNAATKNVGNTSGTVAAGDDGRFTGNEKTANKGVANGYAGLDATAKVPIAQLPIPLYQVTGITAVSTNTTITAAQFGVMFDVTGSPTLTLPPKASFSTANPFWCHFRKRDGSGVLTIQCAAGDTFANGKTTMLVYVEHATLFIEGGNWYAPPGGRQTGWITIASQVALTAQSLASYLISAGFNDPEIAELEIKFSNLTVASPGVVGLRVVKGGAPLTTSTYELDSLDQSSTTVTAASASTQSYIPLTTAGLAAALAGEIRIWDAVSAAAKDQRISLTSWLPGARRKMDFNETTAGVLQGLSIIPISSSNITSITYTVKGYRP